MCFSASSSFAASGGLALLGAASFRLAHRQNRILLAIPLLFSIQQAAEGLQWIRLPQGESSAWAGYVFLFFALITWPLYLPVSVYLLDKPRRKRLAGFIALGALISGYFATLLLTQPLRIRELSGSIHYSFNFDRHLLVMPSYLVAVAGPLLLSGIRGFKWFGAGITALAVVSWKFYHDNFLSVWCYFAASVSAFFLLHLYQERAKRPATPA